MSYNRYRRFKGDGTIKVMPYIKIVPKSSDYYETYERGKTRLDILSYDYYGDPNYDWLILLANPQYGTLEFEIPDGTTLRIPYPLEVTLENYEKEIDKYNTLYGN